MLVESEKGKSGDLAVETGVLETGLPSRPARVAIGDDGRVVSRQTQRLRRLAVTTGMIAGWRES